ncbi:MAG: hypothetical protein IKH09_00815 [Clostridia bacterium]|nr:hypothetical protein [Clostridia bacterium]
MKRFKLSKSRLAAAIVLVAILVVGILFPVSGSSAIFTSQRSLGGSVSYMLDDSLAKELSVTETGTYKLIPGTDLTPGAKVNVIERKAIPAYLFIEIGITGTMPDGLVLAEDWKAIEGIADRKIYCYQNAPLTIDVSAPVFDDSFKLDEEPLTEGWTVSVTAYLVEIREELSDSDPAAVFADYTNEATKKVVTDPSTETFVPVIVEAEVQNDWAVKNIGDIDALIRAKVVLNHVDGAGNIDVTNAPLFNGERSELTVPEGWIKIGDYLYWKGVVKYEGDIVSTAPVLDPSEVADGVQITVIAEAIQAEGSAAADAWGVEWDKDAGWTAVHPEP